MQPRKFKTEPPLPPKSIDNDRMDNEHLDSNRLADAEFVTPPATPAKSKGFFSVYINLSVHICK